MTLLTGFDLCRAAMAVTGISAPEKSVLMVLAIMADREDATCFPPINGDTGLTAKTCLSERAVQRAIQRLKDLGHISRRQLRHGCIYTVHPLPEALTPVTQTGVTETPDRLTPVSEASRPVSVAPKQPVTTTSTKATPSPKKRVASPAFVPPSDIPEAEWDGYEEMRRRIGKPMTAKARDLAIGKLRKLADAGFPPGDVLNNSILNSWQGLFPPKEDRHEPVQRHRGTASQSRDGFLNALNEMSGYSAADYRH